MADRGSELAPMSEAITKNIRVEVLSRYSAENSRPLEDNWVFQYTVRITNQGPQTVQLISRHWIITDGSPHTEEVKGRGWWESSRCWGAKRVLPILIVVSAEDADRQYARNLSYGPLQRRAFRYRDRALRPEARYAVN